MTGPTLSEVSEGSVSVNNVMCHTVTVSVSVTVSEKPKLTIYKSLSQVLISY